MSGGNNPASPGSIQLRAYLAARRSGQSTEAAASIAGFNAEEARLTDEAEARGELEHIDTTGRPIVIQESTSNQNSSANTLRLFIERVERLEEEKKGLSDDIKDVFAEAKAGGFDVNIMRAVIKRRKAGDGATREFDALLKTYEDAIEFQMPLPLQAEIREPSTGSKH